MLSRPGQTRTPSTGLGQGLGWGSYRSCTLFSRPLRYQCSGTPLSHSRRQSTLVVAAISRSKTSEAAVQDVPKRAARSVASNITNFRRRSKEPMEAKTLDRSRTQVMQKPKVSKAAVMERVVRSNVVLPMPPKEKRHNPFEGLHKPIGLIAVSAHLLGTVCQVSGVYVDPFWLPTVVGGCVGIGFTILNRFGVRRYWRSPQEPLNVVITGSTRGIGKAIARELIKRGDRVMITARSVTGVRMAMKELRDETGAPPSKVCGVDCDVSSPGGVQRLADAAVSQLGSIDVWINNAGYSGKFQSFLETSPEQLQRIVQTNLLGSLLCTRAALRIMASQPQGGHIFNMDGAGADGLPTPNYTAYGSTKAGIAHLMGSLNEEVAHMGAPVGIHTLSPGMVLTPLLLEGATDNNKAIFNILCEQPETVAAFLAPRVRTVAAKGGAGRYIRFLTLPRALLRFLSAPFAANRFFDSRGEQLYLAERERIMNPAMAKVTARLTARAARRDRTLALAYSLSLALSYLILVVDSRGALPQLPGA